jgi:hypothetical protein
MPADKTVKFISYNSTGLNLVKTNWIRDLMTVCDADFLGLQEHFKKTKTLNNYFRNEFQKHDSYVVPAFREEGRDTGRAKGGLAQLCRKGEGVRKERVMTGSWRLQAQILHFGEWRLLWVNVYFPSDPQLLNYDAEELMAVQAELESILDSGGYDGCICSGDWNYDVRRRSGFAQSMASFLDRVGLVSVWEKFPIDFTHIHTDHKSTSILDNFYVNEGLLQYIDSAAPIHLGDNTSNHSPIMLSLKVAEIPRKAVEEEVRRPRRLAWSTAERTEVKSFKTLLGEKLASLEMPQTLACTDVNCSIKEHTKDRDKFVLDLMCSWIEVGHTAIPLVPAPREIQSNGGKARGRGRIPGWDEKCGKLAEDSRFWCSVWVSAGRPTSGQLHRLMVSTRVKFRGAVRRARREGNTEEARLLLAAAEEGSKALLTEMRRVRGRGQGEQELPDSLEGAVGHTDILNKFRQLYQELYNSAGTEQEMATLKEVMESMIDCRSEAEVSKVTAASVRHACKRMKSGKLDVTGSYSSEVFQYAPDILHEQLAAVFRSFLVHGSITLSVLACSFMPLLKSARKSPSKFDSYRAVAGASQLLKVFEYLILDLWGDCLSSDSMQFGFKPGTGTDQCSWLLLSVAEHFLHRGSPALSCFLDVSKGFARVQFSKLFTICLLEKKLPPIVCRVLAFMYEEQTGFIRLRSRRSAPFSLSNGTREGAAASPSLWAVYADGLLKELRRRGLGCHVAGVWMGAFLYVDDLALLAPTRAVLAEMLEVVVAYGARFNLTFSSDPDPKRSKSFCIFFVGPVPVRGVVYPSPLLLNGRPLPWLQSAVHLGHTLHQSLTMDADTKVRRAKFIASSVEVRNQFSFAHPLQVLKAVRFYSCDAYGSVLWRLDSDSASSYYKAYSSCLRRIWRLPLNTFTYLVEGHLSSGLAPLRNLVIGRYPKFYCGLLSSPSPEVRMMAGAVAEDARTTTASNLAYLRALTGLDPVEAGGTAVRAALPVREVPVSEAWRVGLLDVLLRERSALEKDEGDTKRVTALISSLCST